MKGWLTEFVTLLEDNNKLAQFQSGNHKHHSTETALLSVTDDLHCMKSYGWKENLNVGVDGHVKTGLEITAGQRTMSGLIGELTSQLFVLPVMLTGHNRSYWKWNQLFQLLSVCSEWLCIAKRWSEILGEIELETLFTIRALKQTLGFTRFRSQNQEYFHFYESRDRASDQSRRKKSSFAGFSERFEKKSADIAGISQRFSGLTSPKNNR